VKFPTNCSHLLNKGATEEQMCMQRLINRIELGHRPVPARVGVLWVERAYRAVRLHFLVVRYLCRSSLPEAKSKTSDPHPFGFRASSTNFASIVSSFVVLTKADNSSLSFSLSLSSRCCDRQSCRSCSDAIRFRRSQFVSTSGYRIARLASTRRQYETTARATRTGSQRYAAADLSPSDA
jgi:hypothetical protein